MITTATAGRKMLVLWTSLCLCFSLTAGLILPSEAHTAQQVPASASLPANSVLDLSSAARLLAAPNGKTVDISQGGHNLAIQPGSLLTAAEYLSVMQLIQGGRQLLRLNAEGEATGGFGTLQSTEVSNLQSLVIPTNVKLVGVGFNSVSPLQISGATTIGGTLLTLQYAKNIAAVIDSGNLDVLSGGMISTNPVGQPHLPDTFASRGLTINASSGTIVNSGKIVASKGDVTFNAPDGTNLSVDNSGGTVQASGNINLRQDNYNGTSSVQLSGGNWLSKNLNINDGNGTTNLDVDQATGTVNVTAGELHMDASTPNLKLGNMNISGDPTFYNNAGSVTLTGTMQFSGQDLAVVASQDIYTTGTASIDTSSSTGNGGNVLLMAGVANAFGGAFSTSDNSTSGSANTTTNIAVQGPSQTGGAIDLTQSGGLTSITTGSTATNGSGGNVTMFAEYGTGTGSPKNLTPGTIILPSNSTITTGGSGTGTNGNVLIIAGAGLADPPIPVANAITVGTINATGGTGGGGTVTIAAAQTTLTGTRGYISITNGTVQPDSDTLTYTNVYAGGVNLNNNITASQLTVVAGGNINVAGTIIANSGISMTTYLAPTLSGPTVGGTIGGIGTINSTGPISLSLGNAPVTVATTGGFITVTQNSTTLTIGTAPASLSSLSVAAAADITVSNNIAIGTTVGILTLDTTAYNPYSNNINLNGSVTAQGGVTFTVDGSGTVGGTGSVSSSSILLNLGAASVVLGTSAGNLTVNQAAQSVLTIASPGALNSLTINSGSNISTAANISIGGSPGTGNLSLVTSSSSGTISINNNVVANGLISLTTSGTGTIGGTGTINGALGASLTYGSNSVSLAQSGSNIAATAGDNTLSVVLPTTGSYSFTTATGGSITLSTPITTSNAQITLDVSAGSGTIHGASNVDTLSSTAGSIVVNLGNLATSIAIASGNFDITAGGSTLIVANPTSAGSLSVNSAGAITTAGAIALSGTTSLSLDSNAGSNLTLGGNITTVGGITLAVSGAGEITGGTFTLSSNGPVSLMLGSASGVTVNESGTTFSVTQGSTPTQIASSNSSSITIQANANITTNIAISSVGSLELNSTSGNVTLDGGVTTSGSVTLQVTGSGTITQSAGVITTGQLTVNAGTSGTTGLNVAISQLTSNMSGASLSIDQTVDSPMTLNNSNLGSGSLMVVTPNSINVAGTVAANGGITLTTTATGTAPFTIGGSGTLNSTGPISLNFAGNSATLGTSGGLVTVTSSGVTATIGTLPTSIQSLLITANGGITLTNPVNIVSGSITLQSSGTVSSQTSTDTLSTTGSIILTLGNAVTLGLSGGQLTVTQQSSTLYIGTTPTSITALNITAPGGITTGTGGTDISLGSGSLSLTSSSGNISIPNNITANGGISLSVPSSSYTIGGSGTINSTGPITVGLGNALASISSSASSITINEQLGLATLTIGTTPSSVSALTVSGGSLTLGPLTIGGASTGTLTASASTGDNISIAGNIVANGGITLSVTGTNTINGTSTISSAGTITINLGTNNVTLTQAGSNTSLAQNSSTLIISNLGSLTLSTQGSITIGSALTDTGKSTLNLSSYDGNIALNGNISGYDVLFGAAGTVGGTGTVTASDFMSIYVPNDAVTLSTGIGKIQIANGSTVLSLATPAAAFAVGAATITIGSGTTITASNFLILHTEQFTNNGTLTVTGEGGLIQIDNNGFSGGLTLSGSGASSVTIPNGGTINVYDLNGAQLNINSSYNLNPGAFGIVRVWEATLTNTYPQSLQSTSFVEDFDGFQINPNAGQIILATGVTLSMQGYGQVGASTITIGSGAKLQLTGSNSPLLYIQTDNLIDNGTITDTSTYSGTGININDQGLNPSMPIVLSGTPSTITATSASGSSIQINDFNGQQIDINSSYTFNAGPNGGLSGIWESSLGGDATPSGSGDALESTHVVGSIVVAPNVTLTWSSGEEVEFDCPTQIYNTGSKFIVTGTTSQMTLECNRLVNNGSIINEVSESLIGIGNNDQNGPSAADCDIIGNISISGTGSIGFSTGVSGQITVINYVQGTNAPADLTTSIVFSGSQTFTCGSAGQIGIYSTNALTFAPGTTQTFNGQTFIDAPKIINNGSLNGIGGLQLQNTSQFANETQITNNGSITNSSSGSLSIQCTGACLLSGTGGRYSDSTGTLSIAAPGTIVLEDGTNLTFVANSLSTNEPLTMNAASASADLTFSYNSGTLTAPISIGSGTLTLSPLSASTQVAVGSGSGLVISSSLLNSITAGLVVIGSTSSTGGITLNTQITMNGTPGTTPGVYALSFETAGTYASSQNISTDGQNVTIEAGALSVGSSSINVNNATVSLIPSVPGETVSIAGGSGSFLVSASLLQHITAGNVIIGSTANNDNVTLGGPIVEPGSGTAGTTAGVYPLEIETGGNYGNTGTNAINTQSNSFTINALGTVNTGTGGITAATISITGASVNLGDNVTATVPSVLTITSTTGSISQSQGTVTATNINLQSAADIYGTNDSATNPLSVSASGTLTFTAAGNAYISSSSSLTLGASSATTVALVGSNSEATSINGGSGPFVVSAADLAAITANKLIIGSTSNTGGVTLAASLTEPASGTAGTTPGLYDLDIESGGSYTGGGNSINVQGQNLTINTLGNLPTGTGSLNAHNITLSGNGIVIDAAITASATLNLTATGSGTISQTGGSLVAQTVNLQSSSGDIFGTADGAATPLSITTSALTVNSGANAYVSNTGALTLGNSSVGMNFAVFATGVTIAGSVQAPNGTVTLAPNVASTAISVGGNSGFIVPVAALANITALKVAIGTTADTGDITIEGSVIEPSSGTAGTTAGVYELDLATSGNLTLNSGISTSGQNVSIVSNTVTLNSALNVGSGTVTLIPSSAGGTAYIAGGSGPFVVSTSDLSAITASKVVIGSATTTGGIVLASSVTETSGTPGVTAGSYALDFETSGQFVGSGNTLGMAGQNVNFNTGADIFGSADGPSTPLFISNCGTLTVTTPGNAYISLTGPVTLGSSTVGQTFSVNSNSSISQANGSSINSSTLSITTTSAGTVGPLSVVVSNLTLSTMGPTTINNTGLLSVSGSIGSGTISSTGDISTSGLAATGGSLTLSSGGDLTTTGAVSSTGTTTLSTTGANGSLSLGATVSGNSIVLTSTGTGTITESGGTLNLTSPPASLQINAGTGNVGPLTTNATTVTLNTLGSTNITDTNASTVAVSGSVGSLTFTTTNAGLSTTGLIANSGDITLSAQGNISTTGTVQAVDVTMTSTATNGSIALGGNVIAASDVVLTATGTGSITQTAGSVIGNSITLSSGSGAIGTSTAPIVTIAPAGTITINTTGTSSISNSVPVPTQSLGTGADLVLPASLTFSGSALTILSSGNVVAGSKATTINLSSTKADGGTLYIIAGFSFTPDGTEDVIGAPSPSGGSVFLNNVTINTSTKAVNGNGGNVVIVAAGGSENAGLIAVKSVTTSATSGAGKAGSITLIGQGGVIVNGSLTAQGPRGGNVTVSGSLPQIVGGSISVSSGGVVGGAGRFAPSAAGQDASAAISIGGSIITRGTAGRAGSVSLGADASIKVTGDVIATASGAASYGGQVSILSSAGSVYIGKGGINTSALTVNSSGQAGNAGTIVLSALNFITVSGDILANGASNSGSGAGGDAGNLTLTTSPINDALSLANGESFGTIKVTGYINISGGSGSNKAGDASSNGGDSGILSVTSGTFAVTSSSKGISINDQPGQHGKRGTTNGTIGGVSIHTYALQQMPSDFDLTSTKANIPVLAGGMFTVGIAAPVNGVAGTIAVDALTATTGTSNFSISTVNATNLGSAFGPVNGEITDTGSNGFGQNQATIQIQITQPGFTPSASTPIVFTSGNLIGKRGEVTPAEAVNLFEQGRAATPSLLTLGTNGSINGAAIGGSATFDQIDTNGTNFTAFKIPGTVSVNITGNLPAINVSGAVLLSGALNFTTSGSTDYLNVGSAALAIGTPATSTTVSSTPGAAIDASGNTLILSGTNAKWTNNDNLTASELVIARPSAARLTFATGIGAKTDLGEIVLGPSIDVGMSANITATDAAEWDTGGATPQAIPVVFGNVLVPTLYAANAAARAATYNQMPKVIITFALSENNAGTIVPITAVVGGDLAASSISITSASGITVADNATLTAGQLSNSAPNFGSGLLSSNEIIKNGSIVFSTAGPTVGGEITFGNNDQLTSNGSQLNVTAKTGNIIFGNGDELLDRGGNVVVLANGSVTGGAGNSFLAQGVTKTSTGGVEIAGGTTVSTVIAAFKQPPGTRTGLASVSGVSDASPSNGAIVVSSLNAGMINFNTGGTSVSSLDLSGGGVVVLHADGLNGIQMTGNVLIQTEASKPVSFTLPSNSTVEFIVNADDDDLADGTRQ